MKKWIALVIGLMISLNSFSQHIIRSPHQFKLLKQLKKEFAKNNNRTTNTSTIKLPSNPPNLFLGMWSANTYTLQGPDDWGTLNTDALGGPKGTYPLTSNPGEGDTSARLVTSTGYAAFGIPDTLPGIIRTGNHFFDGFRGGRPYTQQPTSLSFLVQAYPKPADSAVVFVNLTHYDTSGDSAITVASGGIVFDDTISSWTTYTTPITYFNCLEPDTIVITAVSSASLTNPKPNSELWVDSFSLNIPAQSLQSGFSYNDMGNQTVSFQDTSTGNIAAYQWTFGDGDSAFTPNPTHTYDSGGIYQACLTILDSSGRCDIACKNVIVCDITADFVFSGTCVNDSTYFTDRTDPTPGIPVQNWYWDFGDGDTAVTQHPTHKYASTGTYTAELVVIDSAGCRDTLTQSINITSTTTVDLGNDTSFCADESLTLDAGSAPISYAWSNGDSTRFTQVSSGGTYWVIGNSSCGSDTDTVVVTEIPLPPADAGQDTSICAGDNIDLKATGGSDYLWSTGDTTQTITVSPSTDTTYFVEVTDSFGCSAYDSINILMRIPPVAMFGYSAQGGGTIDFTDSSANASQWYWRFGDGDTSSMQHPSHTYSQNDTFQVCLTVTNRCGDTSQYCQDLTVNSVGINDIQTNNSKIRVFPNPNQGHFVLKIGDISNGPVHVKVFNVLGENMYKATIKHFKSNKTHAISLPDHAKGVYFLNVSTKQTVFTKRIVIH